MAETRENEAFYFQWHVTEKCNNDCKHCYSRGKRLTEETSTERFSAILSDIVFLCRRWKRKIHISLVGGDPLLHNSFLSFIQTLYKTPDVRISVAGNPETLTLELMRWLKKRIFAFQVSIDGIQETHDWFRYQGSYKVTINCIKQAKECGLRMHVMTTVSQRNIKQLVRIMHDVYKAGATHWTFGRYVPPVGVIDDIIKPADLREALITIEKDHQQYESQHNKLTKEPLLFPLRNRHSLSNLEENPDHCQIEGCGVGSLALTILSDNTIMACRRHSGSVLGKWKKKGDLLDIFLHSPIIKILRNVENIEKCKDCVFLYYCRGCRAVGYAVRGNFTDPDPSCSFFVRKEVNYGS